MHVIYFQAYMPVFCFFFFFLDFEPDFILHDTEYLFKKNFKLPL